MFEEKEGISDRTFITLLIVAVFVVLLGIRFYANHLQESKARAAELEQGRTSSEQEDATHVLRLETIPNVYECDRDGQRVLTDRPCGTGVPIRVIGDQGTTSKESKREGGSESEVHSDAGDSD